MQKKTSISPRITIPEGQTIEDIMARLELSVNEAEMVAGGINQNYCCVDASVVSPFSTVSVAPEVGG